MMAVLDDLRDLPGDLSRQPMGAASLALSVLCLATFPLAIYGGNIAVGAGLALAALATLSKADDELEDPDA